MGEEEAGTGTGIKRMVHIFGLTHSLTFLCGNRNIESTICHNNMKKKYNFIYHYYGLHVYRYFFLFFFVATAVHFVVARKRPANRTS